MALLMRSISLVVLLLAACGGGRSPVRADASPPPAPRPNAVEPPAARPAPATDTSAEPTADAVCRLAWRMPIEPAAEGPTTLAGLDGWAVLVTGSTRFNLVSNRAAPERIELPASPSRAYAARGRDRGGVIAL